MLILLLVHPYSSGYLSHTSATYSLHFTPVLTSATGHKCIYKIKEREEMKTSTSSHQNFYPLACLSVHIILPFLILPQRNCTHSY